MAKKDRMYMPMGTGGLLRYSEEGKELIKIKPKQLIVIVVAVVALELFLKLFLG